MRPLIIDSFAGGGGASEGIRAAIGRLLPLHVTGLLSDALLLGATGRFSGFFVGVHDTEPLHQIGLAGSRCGSFNEGLPIGRVVLRSRHGDAPISRLCALRHSLFREAKCSGNPLVRGASA